MENITPEQKPELTDSQIQAAVKCLRFLVDLARKAREEQRIKEQDAIQEEEKESLPNEK